MCKVMSLNCTLLGPKCRLLGSFSGWRWRWASIFTGPKRSLVTSGKKKENISWFCPIPMQKEIQFREMGQIWNSVLYRESLIASTLWLRQLKEENLGINFLPNAALKLITRRHIISSCLIWLLHCYLSGMLIDKTWLQPLGIMTV